LLMFPLLLRLMSTCSDSQIRASASAALCKVDASELVDSFVGGIAEIEHLSNENSRISSDLLSVRSAATLPF
jgi:hypothetical protein